MNTNEAIADEIDRLVYGVNVMRGAGARQQQERSKAMPGSSKASADKKLIGSLLHTFRGTWRLWLLMDGRRVSSHTEPGNNADAAREGKEMEIEWDEWIDEWIDDLEERRAKIAAEATRADRNRFWHLYDREIAYVRRGFERWEATIRG